MTARYTRAIILRPKKANKLEYYGQKKPPHAPKNGLLLPGNRVIKSEPSIV